MQKRFWLVLLATVLWAAGMQVEIAGYVQQPSRFGVNFPVRCESKAPLIAQLELARDPYCFASLIAPVGDQSQNAKDDRAKNLKVATWNTYGDFVFIVLYALTFVLFARLLRGTAGRAVWLSTAVVILILAAAMLDVVEDVLMLGGFHHVCEGSLRLWTSGVVSSLKWSVFGVATAALGALCFIAEKPWLRKVIAVLLMVSGLVTLTGTLMCANPGPGVIALGFAMVVALVSYFPWRKVGGAITAFLILAYLVRFSILNGLLLAVVLPAGYSYAPSIFLGLFDALAPISFFLVCFAAFLLALIVMITLRITLAYAPDRFADVNGARPWVQSSWWSTILFSLLAVPMVVMTWIGTGSEISTLYKLGAVVLAAGFALLFLYVTARLHAWVEDPNGSDTVSFIYPPFRGIRPTGGAPDLLSMKAALALKSILPFNLDAGYVRPQLVNGQIQTVLRSGHVVGTIALVITLLIYVVVGWLTAPNGMLRSPAAMVYVLLLLSLLTWLFSGAAFFLDKLRVPVLTAVLAASMLVAVGGGTDHVFRLYTQQSPGVALPYPSQVIDDWAEYRKRDKGPIVVVATAGGGIRASAWTTKVLTGLAEECGSASTPNPFTSSVVLISSVSGGSEGAMYFAGWYDKEGNTDPTLNGTIFDESTKTDLGAIGWGLVYPDLLRTIPGLNLFVPQHFDRGSALEREWVKNWSGFSESPKLSAWNQDVVNGTRPSVIFNATVSENGNRFIAATSGLYETPEEGRPATLQFFRAFTNEDIDVSTAARLSATFPYVSPMSRPDTKLKYAQLHLGDGGYYDNSGLLSALQWLMGAGKKLKDHPVYLVIIDATSSEKQRGGVWSWQRQIVAPIGTLLAVRTNSQETRADIELHAIMKELGFDPDIRDQITPVFFHYPADDTTPLSWHLLASQKKAISDNWDSREKGKSDEQHPERKKEFDMLTNLGCKVSSSQGG